MKNSLPNYFENAYFDGYRNYNYALNQWFNKWMFIEPEILMCVEDDMEYEKETLYKEHFVKR